MNRIILSFPIFAAFAVGFISSTANSSFAQDHPVLLIGPVGGYEGIVYRTDNIPVLNLEPQAFIAQNGNGQGYYLGLSMEHSFLIPEHLYYLLEFGYSSIPANFNVDRNSYYDSVPPTLSLYAKLWTKLSYYMLNWGLKYDFDADSLPRGFGIQACISIGIKSEADYWKTINSSSGSVTNAEPVSEAQSLRFAIRSELTYDWPLNDHWVVTPSIGYDAPITKVENTYNWKASAFYGGVAVRYAIW